MSLSLLHSIADFICLLLSIYLTMFYCYAVTYLICLIQSFDTNNFICLLWYIWCDTTILLSLAPLFCPPNVCNKPSPFLVTLKLSSHGPYNRKHVGKVSIINFFIYVHYCWLILPKSVTTWIIYLITHPRSWATINYVEVSKNNPREAMQNIGFDYTLF